MAPRYEALPIVTEYGTEQLEDVRRVSSIQKNFGLAAQKGTSSAFNVGINLAKTAAGTGILALPYACKHGGILLFVAGMFVISFWNVYCMKQLCESLEYLIRLAESPNEFLESAPFESQEKRSDNFGCCRYGRSTIKFRDPPPEGTSTFSKLGWYALGDLGRWSIDLMMLMLLLFITIAYEVAALSFAEGTPFTTGEKFFDAIIFGLILVPFCIVEDLSALSKLSRLGLIVLGFTMAVVAWYGVIKHHSFESSEETIGAAESKTEKYIENTIAFNLFPLNGIEGVSKWFGCIVFSFGIVPLTFNFRESMAEPEKLPQTAMISMTLVGLCYVIIGISFLYLFPDIENDLLAEIPSTGFLATGTRLAMIVVVLASTPLLVVPCAEMVEGKIMKSENGHEKRSRIGMIVIRTFILLATVSVAVKLPGFVSVLSFVGCFAVSMVSFVLPPALHWLLFDQGSHDDPNGISYPSRSRIYDISMLLIGVLTTVITTWFSGSW